MMMMLNVIHVWVFGGFCALAVIDLYGIIIGFFIVE